MVKNKYCLCLGQNGVTGMVVEDVLRVWEWWGKEKWRSRESVPH
jgi:hypothetical protein